MRVFVLDGTSAIGSPTVRERVKRGALRRDRVITARRSMGSLAVGRIARAFAKRFDTPQPEPQIISATAIAAGFGEWAKGYALDPRLSGAKARYDLGRSPEHLDPERDIARLP